MQPLISVIIPTLNRSHIIGKTIESCIAQTYHNWECIVIDDGSKDYTDELLQLYCKKDSRIRFLQRPHSRRAGGNAARNYGFENCNGDYVLWLDSDDILHDKHLEEKLKLCKSNPDLVLSNYCYSSYDLTKSRPRRFDLTHGDLFLSYVTDNIEVQIHSCLWNRKFLKGKLFDESLSRFQDNDFNLRMFYRTPDYKITNKRLGFVRYGINNRLSNTENQNIRNQIDIFKYRKNCVLLLNNYKNKEVLSQKMKRIVSKKTIWAYYNIFALEQDFTERIKIYRVNFSTCRESLRISEKKLFFDVVKLHFYSWILILYKDFKFSNLFYSSKILFYTFLLFL